MIESLQRVEYIRPNGTVIVLLDFGNDIEAEIPLPIDQQVSSSAAALARWGEPQADGAARTAITWTIYKEHPSFKMTRGYCAALPAMIPLRETGTLRIHFREPEAEDDSDDEIWEFRRAAYQGCSPVPLAGETTSMATYRFEVGERRPIKGPYGPLHPAAWNLVPAQDDTMIVGAPSWPVETYTPPALSPGTPPVLVPAGSTDPVAPPVLVPFEPLNPGGGAPTLRISGEFTFGFYPWLVDLIALDFEPDETDTFGKPKWKTPAITGRWLVITTNLDPSVWVIEAKGVTDETLNGSTAPAEFPWLAEFYDFGDFGIGSGVPTVFIP